jgi:hypothetical protein
MVKQEKVAMLFCLRRFAKFVERSVVRHRPPQKPLAKGHVSTKPTIADDLVRGEDDARFRVFLEDRRLMFQISRRPVVVLFQEGDILSAGVGEPQFVSGDDASVLAIGVTQDQDLVVQRGRPFSNQRERVVGRSIIDDKEFEIRQRLAQDRIDGLPEKILAIVYRQDHAKER